MVKRLVAALAVAGLAAAQIEDEDTCTAQLTDNFAARLSGGACYGQCLAAVVVLVFDGSEYADASEFCGNAFCKSGLQYSGWRTSQWFERLKQTVPKPKNEAD